MSNFLRNQYKKTITNNTNKIGALCIIFNTLVSKKEKKKVKEKEKVYSGMGVGEAERRKPEPAGVVDPPPGP